MCNDYEEFCKKIEEQQDNAFRTEFADMFVPLLWNNTTRKIEVSIGEGWNNIIREMCAEIKTTQTIPGSFRWLQIKEKFGTLRAYYAPNFDPAIVQIDKIISKYEKMSGQICEICGDVGQPRTNGWIKTLCEKHHQERIEKNQRKYGLTTNV